MSSEEETAAGGQPEISGTPTPPTGDPARQRSTIEFPYQNLESAVEVVKAVHAVGGQSCPFDALAAKLDMKADAGGFRLRLSTAKIFGLLNYDRGTVSLTSIGTRMCDPEQEAQARADAFLAVPLYEKIHEQFKGTTLPPIEGLENAMVALGVSPKQKDKARQVFQRSAKEAGFFRLSADRLVMPAAGRGRSDTIPMNPPAFYGGGEPARSARRDVDQDLHPFIQGLLTTLPKNAGDEWSAEDRRKWLQAAATIFDLIYVNGAERKTIKVQIED
jgi:hypothetical protein